MFKSKEKKQTYNRLRKSADKIVNGDWIDLHETDFGVDGKKIDPERLIGLIELVRLVELEVRDLHTRLDEIERKLPKRRY